MSRATDSIFNNILPKGSSIWEEICCLAHYITQYTLHASWYYGKQRALLLDNAEYQQKSSHELLEMIPGEKGSSRLHGFLKSKRHFTIDYGSWTAQFLRPELPFLRNRIITNHSDTGGSYSSTTFQNCDRFISLERSCYAYHVCA